MLGVVLLAIGWIHWQRANVWSTDTALFEQATRAMPDSGYAWHLRGMQAVQEGRFHEATAFFYEASTKEHQHYMSAELYLRSALEIGAYTEAFQFAEAGPKTQLSQGYLEAWLKAAEQVGAEERAIELRRILTP